MCVSVSAYVCVCVTIAVRVLRVIRAEWFRTLCRLWAYVFWRQMNCSSLVVRLKSMITKCIRCDSSTDFTAQIMQNDLIFFYCDNKMWMRRLRTRRDNSCAKYMNSKTCTKQIIMKLNFASQIKCSKTVKTMKTSRWAICKIVGKIFVNLFFKNHQKYSMHSLSVLKGLRKLKFSVNVLHT